MAYFEPKSVTPILGVGGLRLRFGARFWNQIILMLISFRVN